MSIMGLNRVQLLGQLTKDATENTTKGGAFCSTFQLATTRRYQTQHREWKEETAFLRIVFWNSERVFPYLKGGRQVCIDGHLQTWRTPEGHWVTEVSVENLLLTGTRQQSEESEETASPEAMVHLRNLEQYEAELIERARKHEAKVVDFEKQYAEWQAEIAAGRRMADYVKSPRGANIGDVPRPAKKRAAPAAAAKPKGRKKAGR
jgi:single stranded DNA-binding protein